MEVDHLCGQRLSLVEVVCASWGLLEGSFIHGFICSFTHNAFIHVFMDHPLIHCSLSIHVLTHSFTESCLLFYSLIYSLSASLPHSLTPSFLLHSFTHSFTFPFIHALIHLFIHSLTPVLLCAQPCMGPQMETKESIYGLLVCPSMLLLRNDFFFF